MHNFSKKMWLILFTSTSFYRNNLYIKYVKSSFVSCENNQTVLSKILQRVEQKVALNGKFLQTARHLTSERGSLFL